MAAGWRSWIGLGQIPEEDDGKTREEYEAFMKWKEPPYIAVHVNGQNFIIKVVEERLTTAWLLSQSVREYEKRTDKELAEVQGIRTDQHGMLDMSAELREVFNTTQTATVVLCPPIFAALKEDDLWVRHIFPWIEDPKEFTRLSFVCKRFAGLVQVTGDAIHKNQRRRSKMTSKDLRLEELVFGAEALTPRSRRRRRRNNRSVSPPHSPMRSSNSIHSESTHDLMASAVANGTIPPEVYFELEQLTEKAKQQQDELRDILAHAPTPGSSLGRTPSSLSLQKHSSNQSIPSPPANDDQPFDVDLSTLLESGMRAQQNATREMNERMRELEKERMELQNEVCEVRMKSQQDADRWEDERVNLQKQLRQLTSQHSLSPAKGKKKGSFNNEEAHAMKEKFEQEKQDLIKQARDASKELEESWKQWEQERSQLETALAEAQDKKEAAVVSQSQQVEQEKISAEKSAADARAEATALRTRMTEKEEELTRKENELRRAEKALRECESSQRQVKRLEEELATEKQYHQSTAAQLSAMKSEMKESLFAAAKRFDDAQELWSAERTRMQEEIEKLRNVVRKVSAIIGEANGEEPSHDKIVRKSTELSSQTSLSMEIHQVRESELLELRANLEDRLSAMKELQDRLAKAEDARRQMHNKIQELRGNIRVMVRVRPYLPSDGVDLALFSVSEEGEAPEAPALPNVMITDDKEPAQLILRTEEDGYRDGTDQLYTFDRVFPPSSGQEDVFDEVKEFVQSALDGFRVVLFSYGQTGSGKTFTMQGYGKREQRGIIPRAVEQIMEATTQIGVQTWEYTLEASFLEIYNESLRDLLIEMGPANGGNPPALAIKKNEKGDTVVQNLVKVPIDIYDQARGGQQLDRLMAIAEKARSVASTAMNAVSSRSHSVFQLHISGRNKEVGTTLRGTLNLCDLAGSERLDRSKSNQDRERLRETQSINKSLSQLATVFGALSQGAQHVPFRDSKLTYLLQDCLAGDGKALMFVCVSPTMESVPESTQSLRFARQVNQVELGKPTKMVQMMDDELAGNGGGGGARRKSGLPAARRQTQQGQGRSRAPSKGKF